MDLYHSLTETYMRLSAPGKNLLFIYVYR
uniref:Uncharacterized protein n=1 Tax=Arundo donax TaxID=35708 RepID=A0A0A9C8X5_ARUDO